MTTHEVSSELQLIQCPGVSGVFGEIRVSEIVT